MSTYLVVFFRKNVPNFSYSGTLRPLTFRQIDVAPLKHPWTREQFSRVARQK